MLELEQAALKRIYYGEFTVERPSWFFFSVEILLDLEECKILPQENWFFEKSRNWYSLYCRWDSLREFLPSLHSDLQCKFYILIEPKKIEVTEVHCKRCKTGDEQWDQPEFGRLAWLISTESWLRCIWNDWNALEMDYKPKSTSRELHDQCTRLVPGWTQQLQPIHRLVFSWTGNIQK